MTNLPHNASFMEKKLFSSQYGDQYQLATSSKLQKKYDAIQKDMSQRLQNVFRSPNMSSLKTGGASNTKYMPRIVSGQQLSPLKDDFRRVASQLDNRKDRFHSTFMNQKANNEVNKPMTQETRK